MTRLMRLFPRTHATRKPTHTYTHTHTHVVTIMGGELACAGCLDLACAAPLKGAEEIEKMLSACSAGTGLGGEDETEEPRELDMGEWPGDGPGGAGA